MFPFQAPASCPPVLLRAFTEERGAILSPGPPGGEPERHLLWRRWGSNMTLVVIGLNPSTADGTKDDATIRSVVRLARARGYNAVWMLNLYPLRATDPQVLYAELDKGRALNLPEADRIAKLAIHHAAGVACAWGAMASAPIRLRERFQDRAAKLLRIAQDEAARPMWWGETAGGHPKHPLYLRTDAALTVWPAAFAYGVP